MTGIRKTKNEKILEKIEKDTKALNKKFSSLEKEMHDYPERSFEEKIDELTQGYERIDVRLARLNKQNTKRREPLTTTPV